MADVSPQVIVIAGPNGAGKTTSSKAFLREYLDVGTFVNADIIAQGISGFSGDLAAVKAGEIMLDRLHELAAAKTSFAFETTLASRTIAAMARKWIADGYQFHLLFIYLSSPELAIARVKARVEAGGHDIPPQTIERRYHRGLSNFFSLYHPLAATWTMYNNSIEDKPSLVATGGKGVPIRPIDPELWKMLESKYGRSQ